MPNVLLNADLDRAINWVQRVEPALHEQSPLQTKGGDEEVESDPAEAVALKESHEKAETHKDHHMYVLETWEGGVVEKVNLYNCLPTESSLFYTLKNNEF